MPAPARPAQLVGRVFRGTEAIAGGLLTRDALRSRCWRRLFRDVYADAALPDDHRLRLAGAALLVPPDAVVSGRSAAYLLGLREAVDEASPVEVTIRPGCRFGPVAGLRVRRAPVPAADMVGRGRHRCTSEVRTALDVARLEPLLESVPLLDAMLGRSVVDHSVLTAAATALPTGRGCRRAQQAVALADERAESPPESRLRVLLTLAGLPPVPQWRVGRPDGVFIARVDLGYPAAKVAVEYDGAWHGAPGELGRDRRRINALVQAGWRVLYVTAADLHRPGEVVARVRALLAAAEIGVVGHSTGR
ncbi:endonuclease domain-containing protein [Modestobacter lapidis]|nr:hypothetical protein [Modestobacter lapidis]